MFDTKDTRMVERALLVRVAQKSDDPTEAQSLLDELEQLVDTLGIPIVDKVLVRVQTPQPKFFVGSGKAEELLELMQRKDIDVVIFDNSLAPSQQRNWEKFSGRVVIDREEVILDIFARHAQTKEARLQVELARLRYSLPRLTRAWGHLGRQGGAGGLASKGEGESQLELDRRMIRTRIAKIQEELEVVLKQRATQRKERERLPAPHAAIVGYTNAGKSSLLNRLTGADTLVENKLFATLDTTTRRIELANGQVMLLTDTVGFIRNLPHHLVESFKATLEEAALADFRIHVLDASQPEVFDFHRTTVEVLKELGADTSSMLTVLNKIDLVEDRTHLRALENHFPEAVCVSVRTGEGLELLEQRLEDFIADRLARLDLSIPQSRADLIALAHQIGQVLSTEYEDDQVLITAVIPRRLQSRFAEFVRAGRPSPSVREGAVPA
jgi:GTP-binding protein HflX